jgi:hypothetical protein
MRAVRRCILPKALLASLALLSGCQSSLSRGVEAYDQSQYPEAIAELRRGEVAWPRGTEPERTRYALYRGLAHLALGDAHAAESWLRWARQRVARQSALLNTSERGRLDAAWRSLGHMPGDG